MVVWIINYLSRGFSSLMAAESQGVPETPIMRLISFLGNYNVGVEDVCIFFFVLTSCGAIIHGILITKMRNRLKEKTPDSLPLGQGWKTFKIPMMYQRIFEPDYMLLFYWPLVIVTVLFMIAAFFFGIFAVFLS